MLAVDSRLTGDYIHHIKDKLSTYNDGHFTLIGDFWDQGLWRAVLNGEEPRAKVKGSTLIFTRGKSCYELQKNSLAYRVKGKYAWGSGSHFAVTAMYLGKSAAEAVKIASHFDERTGGKVQYVNV